MSGHEYGDSIIGRLIDEFPELPSGHRVHTSRRLVQKDDSGPVENRDRERQFLFPAQRQFLDHRVLLGTEIQLVKEYVSFLCDFLTAHPVDPAEQHQVLLDGHILVKRELLAHIPDVFFDHLRLLGDVVACHGSGPGCRLAQAAEHPHRRSLSGSVRAEESEHLAVMHIEGDVIHGRECPEAFCKVVRMNYFRHHILIKQSSTDGWIALIVILLCFLS